VAQAAVIGVPHEKWGEAVHAVVVAKPGTTVTAEWLIDLVKRELGGIPAPKTIAFADALPVNPAGKVDKKALRAPFWQGRRRQVG
jgi:acyl-CoA synthetase (AMP-forming)/AMP-acid ligase II